MKYHIDHSVDMLCITIEGEDQGRVAEAFKRCRNENQACPIRDMHIQQIGESGCLTLCPEDYGAFGKTGIDRCLKIIAKKLDEEV